MKTSCSIAAAPASPLRWLLPMVAAVAVWCSSMALLGAHAATQDPPETTTMASTTAGDADVGTTTKDSQNLQDDNSCPMLQQVEDFCPELSTNVTDIKRKLTGEWQVQFGFVRASTTRVVCPRITFSPVSGPCTAFTAEFSQQPEDNPLPAPSTLRVAPQGLLVPPGTGQPHLKVLLVQEPFVVVAVCSEASPLHILGLRRTAASTATVSDRASDPAPEYSLAFFMGVHDHFIRLSGPAWFLCSRLWDDDGDAAYRGRGVDFAGACDS